VLVRDPRLELFLERLRWEFEDYVVVALPYRSPDDETIEHFLHLLDVPEDDLGPATWKALEIAVEIYGEAPLPFHLTTIDPETSAKYYAKEVAAARAREAPGLVRARIGIRAPVHELVMAQRRSFQSSSAPWLPTWTEQPTLTLPQPAGHCLLLDQGGAKDSPPYVVTDSYSLAA
jgi:hypothetical protein